MDPVMVLRDYQASTLHKGAFVGDCCSRNVLQMNNSSCLVHVASEKTVSL